MRLTPLQRYRLRVAALAAFDFSVAFVRFCTVALLGVFAVVLGVALSPFIIAFAVLFVAIVAVFPGRKKESKG